MLLYKVDIPIARSILAITEGFGQVQPSPSFASYLALWSAFNNIYAAIALKDGIRPEFKLNDDGTPRLRQVGEVSIPVVKPPQERQMIENAFGHFQGELKLALISHENTAFFVDRVPRWHGVDIPRDAAGQTVNGVINVGHTIDANHPVWAPISKALYDRFRRGDNAPSIRDILANQALGILYAVRNNIVHAGKQPDDANDTHVVEAAFPLLKLVVEDFMGQAA